MAGFVLRLDDDEYGAQIRLRLSAPVEVPQEIVVNLLTQATEGALELIENTWALAESAEPV